MSKIKKIFGLGLLMALPLMVDMTIQRELSMDPAALTFYQTRGPFWLMSTFLPITIFFLIIKNYLTHYDKGFGSFSQILKFGALISIIAGIISGFWSPILTYFWRSTDITSNLTMNLMSTVFIGPVFSLIFSVTLFWDFIIAFILFKSYLFINSKK